MEDLYKLIEAYLAGTLSDDQRREVERRMAEDEDFRREVALHRGLQEEFGDARGWHLFSTLSEIMEESLPADDQPAEAPETKQSQAGNHRKWWWLLPLGLLLCGGIWYVTRQPESPAPIPASQSAPPNSTPDTPRIQTPPSGAPDPPSANNPSKSPASTPNRPIAANFEKNASLEALRNLRRSAGNIRILSPRDSSTVFSPDNQGKTVLRFTGTLEGIRPEARFDLLVFNNTDSQKPVLTQTLVLTPTPGNNATFDLSLQVDFSRGLYYYRIEEADSGEMLMADRFFIGSR